ncbi:MAG: Lrp/AsnC family transcriptional regulator [Saprospiraceae bacterium]|nr:Lrp/AsnC family transcriptional regulator [Saprospiraceae bacterium]
MSDYKLDKIDLKILKLLQENSKITNLDLSRKIGLSPAPTLERVKKLEQAGIILSYHAKVDSTAIGLNVKTYVLVSLAWQKPNALENFIKKVKQVDEITECYIITGDADFLLKIVCKDIPTYEKLLFKTLSQIEEIERLKTLMTLSKVKKRRYCLMTTTMTQMLKTLLKQRTRHRPNNKKQRKG